MRTCAKRVSPWDSPCGFDCGSNEAHLFPVTFQIAALLGELNLFSDRLFRNIIM